MHWMDADWVSEKLTERLELALGDVTGAPFAIATTSGSAALHLALVYRPGDLRTKSLQLLQDGISCGSPVERGLGLVVERHDLFASGDQLFDAGEAASPDRPRRDDAKPVLHLVWPPADCVYSQEA